MLMNASSYILPQAPSRFLGPPGELCSPKNIMVAGPGESSNVIKPNRFGQSSPVQMLILRRVIAPDQEDGSPVRNLLKSKNGKFPQNLIEDSSLQEANNNNPMGSMEENKIVQKGDKKKNQTQ